MPVLAGEHHYDPNEGEAAGAGIYPATRNLPADRPDVEPLRGRATFEGGASGQFHPADGTGGVRSFLAYVSLVADFNQNRISGIVTDGRDTLDHEKLFDALRLESATIRSAEGFSPAGRVSALIHGNAFTGDWTGSLSGNGVSGNGVTTPDTDDSIAGTFRAQRIDDPGESLTGTFDADYRGHISRTVRSLNGSQLEASPGAFTRIRSPPPLLPASMAVTTAAPSGTRASRSRRITGATVRTRLRTGPSTRGMRVAILSSTGETFCRRPSEH